LGAGSGEGVDFLSGGSLRLVELFDEAARRVGTRAARGGEAVDLGVVFDKGSQYDSGAEAPWIGVTWSGWEETAGTPADTLDRISAEKLERSGRCVTLGLMILGREREY